MWEDNTKMNLKETGHEGVSLVRLAQDRVKLRALVKVIMNLRVP
jgi:hypothetical protein